MTLQEKLNKAQIKTKLWSRDIEYPWPDEAEWERIQKMKETKRLREKTSDTVATERSLKSKEDW